MINRLWGCSYGLNAAAVSQIVIACMCLLHPLNSDASESPAAGELFNPAAPFVLKANRTWELYFRLKESSNRWSRLTMLALPSNASFVSFQDGWYRIRWTPSDADVGSHHFRFEGSNPDSPAVSAHDELVAEVIRGDADTQPVQPFPTHIVSAGQIVSIEFDDQFKQLVGKNLVLKRLPGGASFRRLGDGSYRFFWPTEAKDRGEYQFVISTVGTDNSVQDISQTLTVIVIDPSSNLSPNTGTRLPSPPQSSDDTAQPEPAPQPSAVPPVITPKTTPVITPTTTPPVTPAPAPSVLPPGLKLQQ